MKFLKPFFILVMAISILSACSNEKSTTTFEGDVEGMKTTSVVTAEGDDIQTEEITYKLGYDEVNITDEDDAEQVVDMQRESLDEQFGDVSDDAVSYEVTSNDDDEIIEMAIMFDYSKQEYIDELQEVGYIDGDEGGTVSLEKTKEQYEKDGLQEKED